MKAKERGVSRLAVDWKALGIQDKGCHVAVVEVNHLWMDLIDRRIAEKM